MMIDCGHNATTGWRPHLQLLHEGIHRLDILAITNYDEDHVSGLPELRDQIAVSHLWRNRSVAPEVLRHLKSEDGMGPGIDALVDMVRTFNQPSSIALEGVEREAFYLSYPEFTDENNLSFVIFLRINGIGFLFPGDIESAGWEALLQREERLRQIVPTISVLVASHHGRIGGYHAELFTKYGCRPSLVVISDKGYVHETQETVSLYAQHARGAIFRGKDRRVLTTRHDNAITFRFWGDGCSAN